MDAYFVIFLIAIGAFAVWLVWPQRMAEGNRPIRLVKETSTGTETVEVDTDQADPAKSLKADIVQIGELDPEAIEEVDDPGGEPLPQDLPKEPPPDPAEPTTVTWPDPLEEIQKTLEAFHGLELPDSIGKARPEKIAKDIGDSLKSVNLALERLQDLTVSLGSLYGSRLGRLYCLSCQKSMPARRNTWTSIGRWTPRILEMEAEFLELVSYLERPKK